jgi:hypothetical protein
MRARYWLYVALGAALVAASLTLTGGTTWAAPVGIVGLWSAAYGGVQLIERRAA